MPTHELANHLLTLATLRLLTLNSSRFQHVRAIPLQVLSELTERYLALLATTAKRHAEHSGRTQANAADVVHAMQDFGQNLDEVWEWCEERRLGDDDVHTTASGGGGAALSSLGGLLTDTARNTTLAEAAEGSSIIQYAPLSELEDEQEEALRAGLITLPANRERSVTPDLPLKSSLSPSPPPPSYALVIQEDSERALETLYQPPPDLLAFLPPLPDLTASASSQAMQTVTIEDETTGASKTVKRTRRNYAGSNTAAIARSVWRKQIAFEGSQLAEYSTRPLPEFSAENALSRMYNEVQAAQGARPASSLASFLETYNHIVTEANGQDPLPLRHNAKRRRAATAIQSNILINPSDDSLSGAVPTPQARLAKKHAGWIPFPPVGEREDVSEPGGKAVLPFPPLHAFNTSLPPTVSEAVPAIMLPHATATVVPSMHPRYPTAHASIRTLLAATSPALFSRTTRMGPPGPLLETGATGHYEVELEKPNVLGAVGGAYSRMMAYSFDWEVGRETEDAVPALKRAEAARIAAESGLPPPASAAPTPAVTGAPTPAAISAPTPSAAMQAATPAPFTSQLPDAFEEVPTVTTEPINSIDEPIIKENPSELVAAADEQVAITTDSFVVLANGHTIEEHGLEDVPAQPSQTATAENSENKTPADPVITTSRGGSVVRAESASRAQSAPRADSVEVFAAPSPIKMTIKFNRSISRPLSLSQTSTNNEAESASPQGIQSPHFAANGFNSAVAPATSTGAESTLPRSTSEAPLTMASEDGAVAAAEREEGNSAKDGNETANLKALFGQIPTTLDDSIMENVSMAELNPSLIAKAEVESPSIPFKADDAERNGNGSPLEDVKPVLPVAALPKTNADQTDDVNTFASLRTRSLLKLNSNTMNRTWFRNPFAQRHDADDGDTSPAADDAGILSGDVSSNNSKDGNRKRRRKLSTKDTAATSSESAGSAHAGSSYSHTQLPGSQPLVPSRQLASGNVYLDDPQKRPRTYAASLHSISSIKTAHFANQDSVAQRKSLASNGTSMEASPSRTPLRDRMSRLSVMSTASGMIGFDEDDREEAEKRWQEREEAEMEEVLHQHSSHADDEDRDVGVSTTPDRSASRITPSRSSTSLKSILKRNLADHLDSLVPGTETPVRNVTFSPSTLPAAATPPIVTATPEHPYPEKASPLDLVPYVPARPESPPLHVYVNDPTLLSADESLEVEHTLLTKSVTSLLSGAGYAASEARQKPSRARQESSLLLTRHFGRSQREVSNLFETSLPSQLAADETSMVSAIIRTEPTLHAVALDTSSQTNMLTAFVAQPVSSASTKDDDSSSSSPRPAKRRKSIDDSDLTWLATTPEADETRDEASTYYTPTAGHTRELSLVVPPLDLMPKMPTKSSALTPSTSSVSLARVESPFTTLMSHLASAQDDLSSNRANQKNLLLALVTNLRGELASRDRAFAALERQKQNIEQKLARASTEREQERAESTARLERALKHVESTKDRIADEIQRRDEQLRLKLEAEKRKSQDLQAQLSKAQVDPNIIARAQMLEEQLAEALDQKNTLQNEIHRLGDQCDMLSETRAADQIHLQEALAASSQYYQQTQTYLDQITSLERQLSSAEVQISRATTSAEQEKDSLRRQLREASSKRNELAAHVETLTHAVAHEREEHTRQSEFSQSVQDDLQEERQMNTEARQAWQTERQAFEAELAEIGKMSRAALAEKEERITQMETEIFRRSAERRVASESGCESCRDSDERNTFLETEVVRLREAIAKMRFESADREVKVARLRKERDQLDEDKEGLNIALEAKQQQIAMLKRELNRRSSDVLSTTARPVSRINRVRPNSQNESGLKPMLTSSIAKSQFTDSHGYQSRTEQAIMDDTPCLHGAVLMSQAARSHAQATTRSSNVRGMPLRQQSNSTKQAQALEAASLMNKAPTMQMNESAEDKENRAGLAAYDKLSMLPAAPQHPLRLNAEKWRQSLYV